MAEFVSIELETEAETLEQEVYDFLQTRWPDWEPADGNLETWLIQSFSRLAAEVRDLAAEVSIEVFKEYGATIVSVPPLEAAYATTTTTWTMVDTNGYTIPANTQIGFVDGEGHYQIFETTDEVEVPNGSSATSAGEVVVRAINPGADSNGLDNPFLVDALSFVDSIEAVAETSGGTAEEDDADYLDRLASELQLLAPRPILPNDFAVLARRVDGVYRAVAIDGYDPVGETYDNERMITIAAIDDAGAAVSSGVKTAIEDALNAEREVNFEVHTDDPEITPIDVTVTVVAYSSFEAADVQANVENALASYLNPLTWGRVPYGEGELAWSNLDEVRYLEIAEVINQAMGVDYIDSLTVEGGTADVSLTGAAPLASSGTFSVTAN